MLTGKEKRYLRGRANTLQPVVYIGKEGVTARVIDNAEDALKARELVKGSVSKNSPLGTKESAEKIASGAGAQLVQTIGRKFVLYRRNGDNPQIKLPE